MDQQTSNSADEIKPGPVREIRSPKGIQLDPDPPDTVRVSKRAVFVVAGIGCVLASAFGFGVLQRQNGNNGTAFAATDHRRIAPATTAAREIMKDIPPGVVNLADEKQVAAAPKPQPEPAKAPAHVVGSTRAVTQPAPIHNPPQQVSAVPPYQEPSPEEKRIALAYERRLQAELAPTAAGGTLGPSNQQLPVATSEPSPLAAIAQALTRPSAASAQPTRGSEFEDPGLQARKEAYLARARTGAQGNYLKSTRTPPVSVYEIKAGWEIPAALEQGLNSDLPGELKALVTANVYDTATGRHLLIPQGSRLVGTYDSVVAYGQSGLQVVWNRIIFPDGSSIDLGGMIGQDAQGFSGFRHTVDNHYKRLIGTVVLSSLFSAGFQLSQARRGSVLQTPSTGEVAASAVGREVSQVGAQMTRKNLNVQPTIMIPIGYRFSVRVNRDVLFEAPY